MCEGISRHLQHYITSPQIPKILVGKPKEQIYSCLVIVEHGGQKNHNGKTTHYKNLYVLIDREMTKVC